MSLICSLNSSSFSKVVLVEVFVSWPCWLISHHNQPSKFLFFSFWKQGRYKQELIKGWINLLWFSGKSHYNTGSLFCWIAIWDCFGRQLWLSFRCVLVITNKRMSNVRYDSVGYGQILAGQLFDERILSAALNYVTMRGLDVHFFFNTERKLSFCFAHSGNAKNDDLLFPNLLPSMLSCLKGDPENQMVSRSQYCVVVWRPMGASHSNKNPNLKFQRLLSVLQ